MPKNLAALEGERLAELLIEITPGSTRNSSSSLRSESVAAEKVVWRKRSLGICVGTDFRDRIGPATAP